MGLSLGKNCCPLKVLQGRCLRAGLGGSSVDFELVETVELVGGRDTARQGIMGKTGSHGE